MPPADCEAGGAKNGRGGGSEKIAEGGKKVGGRKDKGKRVGLKEKVPEEGKGSFAAGWREWTEGEVKDGRPRPETRGKRSNRGRAKK